MALVDFKPQIRKAIEDSGFKAEEKVVEAIDQLLDNTIPNSIWNHIAVLTLKYEVNKMNTLIRDMHSKAIGL